MQTCARVVGDFVEMVESNHAKQFGHVRRDDAVKIIDAPHAFGERRRSENPSTAQAGKAESFRETAGDNEILAQMKCGARGGIKASVQINFVRENISATFLRDFAKTDNHDYLDVTVRKAR